VVKTGEVVQKEPGGESVVAGGGALEDCGIPRTQRWIGTLFRNPASWIVPPSRARTLSAILFTVTQSPDRAAASASRASGDSVRCPDANHGPCSQKFQGLGNTTAAGPHEIDSVAPTSPAIVVRSPRIREVCPNSWCRTYNFPAASRELRVNASRRRVCSRCPREHRVNQHPLCIAPDTVLA
jgi:hypothetical protein